MNFGRRVSFAHYGYPYCYSKYTGLSSPHCSASFTASITPCLVLARLIPLVVLDSKSPSFSSLLANASLNLRVLPQTKLLNHASRTSAKELPSDAICY